MKRDASIAELKNHAVTSNKKKTPTEINDTRTSRLTEDMMSENYKTLEMCRQYYDSLDDFRERRKRSREYLRGNQWGDMMVDDNGDTITEETNILNQGKVPLKQNVIRPLIRSVIGQYRTGKSKTVVLARKKDDTKISEMLTNTLQTAQYNNDTEEIDARMAEEFFLSGMACSKSSYSFVKEWDTEDAVTKNISPQRVFFNTDIEDTRMRDLRMIGELIDTTLNEIVASFAKNEKEEAKIRGWYNSVTPKDVMISGDGLSPTLLDDLDFYIPSDPSKARIIEVWELVSEWRTYAHDYLDGSYVITKTSVKELQKVNDERLLVGIENGMDPEEIPMIDYSRKKEQFWVVKFLTPYGQCLYQGETIYNHQSHPYTLVAYPLLDGEVWGLVEDIIDQQRSINRMTSLIDSIMGSSAKGVLMVHEDAIPKDMDIGEYAEEWTRFNGVIVYKGKTGTPAPYQVSSNSTNIGAQEMLAMQLKMIQDISGVSPAIQGQQAKSGTPSSLYQQEALNSTTNTRDMFDVFSWYKRQRDTKLLKVIQQFYDEKRYVAVSGNRYAEEAMYYDPEVAGNVPFNLVVTEGVDTPIHRMIIDDQLKGLLEAGVIDGEMYLENSSLPFADKILESINKRKQQMQDGQPMEQMPPELVEQAQQGANPEAMQKLQQFVGR